MLCQVCNAPVAHKRRGAKRILCDKCYTAARGYNPRLNRVDDRGHPIWGPYSVHLPTDGGYDPYEGQSRRGME